MALCLRTHARAGGGSWAAARHLSLTFRRCDRPSCLRCRRGLRRPRAPPMHVLAREVARAVRARVRNAGREHHPRAHVPHRGAADWRAGVGAGRGRALGAAGGPQQPGVQRKHFVGSEQRLRVRRRQAVWGGAHAGESARPRPQGERGGGEGRQREVWCRALWQRPRGDAARRAARRPPETARRSPVCVPRLVPSLGVEESHERARAGPTAPPPLSQVVGVLLAQGAAHIPKCLAGLYELGCDWQVAAADVSDPTVSAPALLCWAGLQG